MRLRRIEGAPSEAALWAVTERGDVMVSDQRLTATEQEMAAETHNAVSRTKKQSSLSLGINLISDPYFARPDLLCLCPQLSQYQLASEPAGCPLPLVCRLERGFTDGCSLVISYKIPANCG